ncbi:glycosyltransferase family 2 protein [Vibrio sp. CAIM 722]|uniref:Glycosyltransferase family 2 protein n=1 Tax=Vibrio eleionomae TaxID=2653505 RepID=A0A7X4RX38_9VIBR|nr:glycosyltransferase family 2 protein [Vibrio eleionomae]MZI96100.1 glycosyltransferase family 2 protein [Vibrio eleionomae]
MKFYFSVISHNHDKLILKLKTLQRLSKYSEITVIFRDNIPSNLMRKHCQELNIDYCSNVNEKGFSENNNLNYLRAKELGMSSSDYFILLNPDVLLIHDEIKFLKNEITDGKVKLAAPNLFLNKNKTLFDDNLRTYPKFSNFIKNYLVGNRSTVINKSKPHEIKANFWASGAFLIIKSELYEELNGFDERYYLYCEDIDFCYRAHRVGEVVTFLPDNTAIHYRRCASRKFLSKEFFWHVISVFKYTMMIHGWAHTRSQLKQKVTDDIEEKTADASNNA